MKILSLEESGQPGSVVIKSTMGVPEFEQLIGRLDNLCVFATKTVNEPASFTKTGARHSWAKYLLFPVTLRRRFRTDHFDFEKLTCSTVLYKDGLYVIYKVPGKMAVESEGNVKALEPVST